MSDSDGSWNGFQLKYCRLCAADITSGVPIFGKEGKRLKISEKIRKTLSVLVLEEDALPKRICTDCCTSLFQFTNFKKVVCSAQEKLMGIKPAISSYSNPSTSKNTTKIDTQAISQISYPKSSSNSVGINNRKEKISKYLKLEESEAVKIVNVSSPENSNGTPIDHNSESSSTEHPHSPSSNDDEKEDDESKLQFPCEFCRAIFYTAPSYYKHVTSSHKERKYFCPLCQISYSRTVSLELHLRTYHADEEVRLKANACASCPASFDDKRDLSRHLRTHLEGRKFKCNTCTKFFKSRGCLNKHIVSCHLSEGKFKCGTCSKGFSRKEKLKDHLNTHSAINTYGCPFCPKKFNSHPNYIKHVRKMHEKEIDSRTLPPPIKTSPLPEPPTEWSEDNEESKIISNSTNNSSSETRANLTSGAESKTNLASSGDNRSSISNTGENRNNFSSPPESRANFSNSSENRSNFSSPPENRANFSTSSENRNNFNSPPENRANFSNSNENRNNFSSPPENRANFSNSNENRNNFSSPPESRSNFSTSGENRNNFNSPPENRANFSSTIDIVEASFHFEGRMNEGFQDMPMELTKVLEESPLELCVRHELMDLTSGKETSFNGIDLSCVTSLQQQPMDLINRDGCYTSSSVSDLMDLSLRSNFSDHSTNSFIRELLDLSSRSEYHDAPPQSTTAHFPHPPSVPIDLNLSKNNTLRSQQTNLSSSAISNLIYNDPFKDFLN